MISEPGAFCAALDTVAYGDAAVPSPFVSLPSVETCSSAAAAVLLPVLLVRAEPVTASDILGIAAIGLICTALAFSLFVSAQKHVSAQTAGIVAGMETVYSILFASLFIGEFPQPREVLGGLIILVMAFLASRSPQKTGSAPNRS